MNIAIYSRKSKATASGESIKNQIGLCRKYAHAHFNVTRLFVYEDEGFSGSHTKRPGFQNMLQDAKGKKFDVLICYRLDRISRNVLDFSTILELLTHYHIEFVSIRDHFDTSTPMGRAMMYIASVFAQLERETIAERIQDNMYKLAESGRWLGGMTPLGYRSRRINTSEGKSSAILELIPEEAARVKEIFNGYEHCKSLQKLQSYTLRHHLKSRRNKTFSLSALKNILMNPVYMAADRRAYNYFLHHKAFIDPELTAESFDGRHGIMAYNKHHEEKYKVSRKSITQWIIAVGHHAPIIPSNQWISIQSVLQQTHHASQFNQKEAILYPLLHCKACHLPLEVKGIYQHHQLRYLYYQCKHRNNPDCGLLNLNGFKAEEQLFQAFDQLIGLSVSDPGLNDLLTSVEKRSLLMKLISSMTWDGHTIEVMIR